MKKFVKFEFSIYELIVAALRVTECDTVFCHATACDATHGISKAFLFLSVPPVCLSACQTRGS